MLGHQFMVFEIIAGALLLGILLLLITMAVWVYRDAKRNEAQYAFGWAAFTFFGGVFGLLLYLVVEKSYLIGSVETLEA